jgi:hypothetical protein
MVRLPSQAVPSPERVPEGGGLAVPELSCLPSGAALVRASVFLALDRPDRLEAEWVTASGDRDALLGAMDAGRDAVLRLGGDDLFRGKVERAGLRLGAGGLRAWLVAYAAFHALRQRCRPESYYELTDAEIASRIALDLGLSPQVETTAAVHPRLERSGDPLRFLRQRARAIDFEFAVTAGTLHFRRRIEPLGAVPCVLRVGEGLAELELEDRGGLGDRGRCIVRGDPGLRPLRDLRLEGFGARWEGEYRLGRSVHVFDVSGYQTTLEFVERGGELETSGEGVEGRHD